MKFKGPLVEATLLKRYFRFLVDVYLKHKQKRTLYCPNLGPLTQCGVLGSRVWFSNTHRLFQECLDVWELSEIDGGSLVCINPEYAYKIVREALEFECIPELRGFRFLNDTMVLPVNHGIEVLVKEDGEQCFMHIEPVWFGDERNEGYFPEEKGAGSAALHELIALREAGHRAVLFYCAQHTGIRSLRPGYFIDPLYGKLLQEAIGKGVEILAYRSLITVQEITLESRIPVLLSEDIISH